MIALENHIKTLQADNEALKEQLAASETKIERQAAESAERLAHERARANKAIQAFASLGGAAGRAGERASKAMVAAAGGGHVAVTGD